MNTRTAVAASFGNAKGFKTLAHAINGGTKALLAFHQEQTSPATVQR
jgi:hypothetical protein